MVKHSKGKRARLYRCPGNIPRTIVALIEDSVSVSVYTHNLHLISHGDLRKATCFYLSVETGSRYLNSVKSRFTIQTLFHGINADLTIFVTAG